MKKKLFKIKLNNDHKYQNRLNAFGTNILRKNKCYKYPNRVRWRTYANTVIEREIIQGMYKGPKKLLVTDFKLYVKIKLHVKKSMDDATDLVIDYRFRGIN